MLELSEVDDRECIQNEVNAPHEVSSAPERTLPRLIAVSPNCWAGIVAPEPPGSELVIDAAFTAPWMSVFAVTPASSLSDPVRAQPVIGSVVAVFHVWTDTVTSLPCGWKVMSRSPSRRHGMRALPLSHSRLSRLSSNVRKLVPLPAARANAR